MRISTSTLLSGAILLIDTLHSSAHLAKLSSSPLSVHQKKLALISVIPRGGDAKNVDHHDDDDDDFDDDPPTFRQLLDRHEDSINFFLSRHQSACERIKDVLDKTNTMNVKTRGALDNLEEGLFRVQIQLSMLPSDLSIKFRMLHDEMKTLQKAATTVLDSLSLYTDLVQRCLVMVESILWNTQQTYDALPQIKQEEERLRQRHQDKKYAKLQQRVIKDMQGLQETTNSFNAEIMVLDKQMQEVIWPNLLNHVQQVNDAAKTVDRLYRSMQNTHQAAGITAATTDASDSPLHPSTFVQGDVVQEVEVEMTTYQFNMW